MISKISLAVLVCAAVAAVGVIQFRREPKLHPQLSFGVGAMPKNYAEIPGSPGTQSGLARSKINMLKGSTASTVTNGGASIASSIYTSGTYVVSDAVSYVCSTAPQPMTTFFYTAPVALADEPVSGF